MNSKAIAFLSLVIVLGAIVVIDPGFARGALTMLCGALAFGVGDWLVKLWFGSEK